ncbi:hypothetical protein B0H14DRAFT_2680654 [Mycena olivaceomarginata]|nr:hypothetical protein B0H14DRAFT_2680654 [Mycena olivaceomarginata]
MSSLSLASNNPGRETYNWPPTRAHRALCTPHQITQPTSTSVAGSEYSSSTHSALDVVPRLQLVPCDFVQPRAPRLQPVALPPQITGITAVTLNPALRSGAGSAICIDFSSITSQMINAWVAQPATFPGLPSLTLLSNRLSWPITAIRQALAIPLPDEQIDELIQRAEGANDINKNDKRANGRCLKRKRLLESGMTRLHLLEGRTRFAGLLESAMGCEVWMLTFV